MSEKLTEEKLIEVLWKVCDMAVSVDGELQDVVSQAYTQLKEIVEEHYRLSNLKLSDYEQGKILIKQKPKVSRGWVDRWNEKLSQKLQRDAVKGTIVYVGSLHLVEMLKEIGVEVEDDR